ncbi:HbrB-domain-containing protein [Panus rudis PR-1116 ss-1]|nr:HbrB-domain-containing protein [Panus rudis PR-1116 ss-1]
MASRSRRASQDASLLMRTPERAQTRSHSIGDDTPRPTLATQGVNPGNYSPAGQDGSPPSVRALPEQLLNPKKSFFSEKLLSSSAATSNSTLRTSPIAPQLLPTRSHSRVDSSTLNSVPRDSANSPTPGMSASPNQPNKGHTSPSKSSTRTYDSKPFSREMHHRLGNLAHLPTLNPSLASASTITLNMPPSASNIASGSATDSPWTTLHVHVLPLFNGERLPVPIEDLNALVKRHIQSTVSAAPAKAISTLEHDASELIAAGMLNLMAKLAGVEEEKLINRIVEVWGFFWDQVLPYVEGALLPLQTDPILSSLYRVPKSHKPTSPAQNGKGSMSGLLHQTTPQIDVRTIALQAFRDRIIYPLFPVLNSLLLAYRDQQFESPGFQQRQPRLQQMLLVLVSQRSLPSVLSLTEPTPPPTPGEKAIQQLLHAMRTPLTHLTPNMYNRYSKGAPSFLSAGPPRDRRGRIDMKEAAKVVRLDDDEDGEDTPRVFGFDQSGKDRGREFLDSLKSPDPESATSTSGWGLGISGLEAKRAEDTPEEEEEPMNWDQAQAVVERMVGMKSEGVDTRRR